MIEAVELKKLTIHAGQLLHAENLGGRSLQVRQLDNLRWMHFGGEGVQCLMQVDEPKRILMPYNQAMLTALLFNDSPASLLNIGFGCGTFERFFAASLPQLAITSVEPNEAVIDLARRFFFISDDHPVVIETADSFLRYNKAAHSMVFCDAFDDQGHPDCLFQEGFYENTYRSLTPNGLLALNLIPTNENEIVRLLLVIRKWFQWVQILEVPDYKNIILFAQKSQPPSKDELARVAESLLVKLAVDLTAIPNRLNKLPPPPTAMISTFSILPMI